MNAKARKLLDELEAYARKKSTSPYIFPSWKSRSGHLGIRTLGEYFNSHLPRLAKEFGWSQHRIKQLGPYKLRHTYATLKLARGNLSKAEIRRQLKHNSDAMGDRYADHIDLQLQIMEGRV